MNSWLSLVYYSDMTSNLSIRLLSIHVFLPYYNKLFIQIKWFIDEILFSHTKQNEVILIHPVTFMYKYVQFTQRTIPFSQNTVKSAQTWSWKNSKFTYLLWFHMWATVWNVGPAQVKIWHLKHRAVNKNAHVFRTSYVSIQHILCSYRECAVKNIHVFEVCSQLVNIISVSVCTGWSSLIPWNRLAK